MPVLAEVAFLHAEGGEFAGEHPPDKLEVGVQIVGVGDVLKGLLEQLFLGVSGDLTKRVVDLEQASLG